MICAGLQESYKHFAFICAVTLLVLSHQLGKRTTEQEYCKELKPLTHRRMFYLAENHAVFSHTRCCFVAFFS